MAKSNKQRNPKAALVWLCIGSFLVCVLPVAIIFAFRWNTYVQAPGDAVKLSIGGIIGIAILVLKTIGKIKIPARIVWYIIALFMAYFLKPIVQDILMFISALLVGEIADLVFFQKAIKKAKEDILVVKTATTTTEQVEAVIKKYVGAGRV